MKLQKWGWGWQWFKSGFISCSFKGFFFFFNRWNPSGPSGCCQGKEISALFWNIQPTGKGSLDSSQRVKSEFLGRNLGWKQTCQAEEQLGDYLANKANRGTQHQHSHCPAKKKGLFLVSNQLIAGLGGWNPNFSDYFVQRWVFTTWEKPWSLIETF